MAAHGTMYCSNRLATVKNSCPVLVGHFSSHNVLPSSWIIVWNTASGNDMVHDTNLSHVTCPYYITVQCGASSSDMVACCMSRYRETSGWSMVHMMLNWRQSHDTCQIPVFVIHVKLQALSEKFWANLAENFEFWAKNFLIKSVVWQTSTNAVFNYVNRVVFAPSSRNFGSRLETIRIHAYSSKCKCLAVPTIWRR